MRFWLQAVSSPAPVEHLEAVLEADAEYREIAAGWSELADEDRSRTAAQLDELFRREAYRTRPFCVRCGQCCTNAGPTLYPGDERLVQAGELPLHRLITHRRGERVYSHAEGRAVVLEHECVQVAASPSGTCSLCDGETRTCTAYGSRPRQCSEQRCWAADAGRALARQRGLGRLDLLPVSSPWIPILEEHDRTCPPDRLRELERAERDGDEAARPAIEAMVADDERLRRRLLDEGASEAELPFLLGLPLRR
jgi:Fe-S-cluster containining protein